MQYALADYLRDYPDKLLELSNFYNTKRNIFCKLLDKTRFNFVPSEGTYFQLADYSGLSDEPDREFAARLTREHKVAAIPVSVFYQEPPGQRIVRFCFAKNDDTLHEAARRLAAIR
ncbi:MAG: aminotransferase class I/II-fold pyridoxal phosphate-dependent enzyme, partial [Xanthomonadales bacterium]|nr:aminotransferase class I/II-fold pyridoxal phosphate-dependent enzyme [Xanthomonadales bacterium]